MPSPWLLYGATGYTGELIAREAVRRGMPPIIAGRSQGKVARLAHELGCESAVFDVDDHTRLISALQRARVVLNCAGPFSATARSMLQACLATRVHYLDITGEIDVFELAHSVAERAERNGIIVCPGVGFDVVPTDSIAAHLKAALPDATELALGFDSRSGLSRGTAKTALEAAAHGLKVRRNGAIVALPLGSRTRRIDFGNGEKLAVCIPWGDVSTAYYTTGIGNIEVYTATTPRALRRQRLSNVMRPLLRRQWVQRLLKRRIERTVRPPDPAQRDRYPTFVWGEARTADGRVCTARLRTSSGYTLTVDAALGILAHVLETPPAPGFKTPTMLVGADFVSSLPHCSPVHIES
jgi:short subunit dehydrogenase-like uncharacterized protein